MQKLVIFYTFTFSSTKYDLFDHLDKLQPPVMAYTGGSAQKGHCFQASRI